MAAVEELISEHIDVWTSAVKRKSSAGRGGGKKIELYGVKKLRELILDLAVRGLLVPQDAGDEPASVLLERIAAEKAELVKAKTIKKPKNIPDMGEDDKPFMLPISWEWITLSHLGTFTGGKTPSKSRPEFWGGDIPWVTPKDMKVESIVDSEDYVTDLGLENGLSLIEKNSLLFVSRSGILRRKFPVAITKVECTVNQDLKVLNLYDRSLANYLLIMMKGFEPYILKNLTKTGTTVESLRFDDFSTHYFLFPPLAEQHRIVAKVDELMALCDQLEQQSEASLTAHQALVQTLLDALTQAASQPNTSSPTAVQPAANSLTPFEQAWHRIAQHFDTLFTTEQSIELLKQNILQLAVMGKLVPQDPNDEPASELLKRIAAEKAELVAAKKIKKQKELPEIAEDEKPFDLPVGWEWSRFGELAKNSDAGWSPKCEPQPRADPNWGVLKVSAVSWGKYKPDENKELPSNLIPRAEIEVKSGDFLISRANTSELVAKAVVVPDQCPPRLMMSDKIIRFEFTPDIDTGFISIVNDSAHSRNYYAAVAGGTSSSMKNVSREQIRHLHLCLPPFLEQHRIVAKVDELIALCDQLKAHLSEAKTTQLLLAEAVTEQAIS